MYSTSSSSFGSTSSNNTSLVQVWVLQVNVRHVSCQQVYVRSSLCYVTIFVTLPSLSSFRKARFKIYLLRAKQIRP